MAKAQSVSISIDNKEVAYVSSCSLEYSRELLETNALGDDHKKKIASQRTWTISVESGVELVGDTAHIELIAAYNDPKEISVSLKLSDNRIYRGKAYIESLSVNVAAGDKAVMSLTLRGNGALLSS